MLSPDQIEEAGERVAAVYREIEARMLDHLARVMAEGWGESPRTVTEAALLAQSQAEELRRMVEEFRPYIDAAVLEVVEECLEASDEDDVARAGGSSEWPAQIDATVKGMAEVLARDNIQMAEGAKQAFLNASIEAVARVNSGDADREAALHRAVRKLERDGIEIITYQDADTGRVTVRNKADVAVRRHVRTQIAQDAARLPIARMKRLGIALVEEITKLITGRYTLAVALFNAVSGLANLFIAVILLKFLPFLNPDFAGDLRAAYGWSSFSPGDLLSHWDTALIPNILLAVITAATLIDIGVTTYRAVRYSESAL